MSNSIVLIEQTEQLRQEEARYWPKVIESVEKFNLTQVLLAFSLECF